MVRTRQKVSGTSTAANEQTHNKWYSAIDKVEEQARRLSNVEQNIDTMQAAMEWVEAMMMQMAQNLYSQAQRQAKPQRSQPTQREEWRSWFANGETHSQNERSPQGSASVSTKRNDATSGQCVTT